MGIGLEDRVWFLGEFLVFVFGWDIRVEVGVLRLGRFSCMVGRFSMCVEYLVGGLLVFFIRRFLFVL